MSKPHIKPQQQVQGEIFVVMFLKMTNEGWEKVQSVFNKDE